MDQPASASLARLDALRGAVEGCEVVIVADLGTRTVLGASGAVRLPQEALDALCAEAADILQPVDGQPRASAVLAGPTGTRVFLRSTEETDLAIALVLPPGAAVGQAMAAAAGYLAAP